MAHIPALDWATVALAKPLTRRRPAPRGSGRMTGAVAASAILGFLTAAAALAYAAYAIHRYARFEAGGFDLGIFDQVVWHYSLFEAPASSIKNLASIWGDHFSPILALLAPLYWIWDDARTLLIAQAVLLGAAAWPIFLYARVRLGDWAALGLAVAYLAFWGVQSAVGFDFHELAFAPLLGACAVLAADRRSWRWFLVAVVALLAVKEDQAFVVVALGLWLLTARQWRAAAGCLVLGAAWYLLVVRLLIPAENPGGGYAYFSYGRLGSGPLALAWNVISRPRYVLETVFADPTRSHTIALLYLPLLFLPLLSRTVIIQLPLLAERFLSTNPAYWNTRGHYTLAIAAFLFLGAADGIGTLTRLIGRVGRVGERVRVASIVGLAGAVLVLQVIYAQAFPLSGLLRADFRSVPRQAADLDRALRAVPPGASVAAEDPAVPRLSHRPTVAEISSKTGSTDYILANVLHPVGAITINEGFATVSRFVDDRLAAYAPAAWSHGWLVLRSRTLPARAPPSELAPLAPGLARRVRSTGAGWMTALAATERALQRCYSTDPTPRCYLAGGAPIAAGQATLEAALATTPAASSPGCRELAGAAASATRALAAALEAVAVTGARRDPAALARGLALVSARQAGGDAPGFLTRLVGLCAPA
ncbi:MAG: hypothetical protein QOF77_1047 [Solirubrobacteraceae bacterium]|nr:hypothetical protein [Solirubrobacteraceae bacterium]